MASRAPRLGLLHLTHNQQIAWSQASTQSIPCNQPCQSFTQTSLIPISATHTKSQGVTGQRARGQSHLVSYVPSLMPGASASLRLSGTARTISTSTTKTTLFQACACQPLPLLPGTCWLYRHHLDRYRFRQPTEHPLHVARANPPLALPAAIKKK